MENKNLNESENNYNFQNHSSSICHNDYSKDDNFTRLKKYSKKYQNYFENSEIYSDDCTFKEFADKITNEQVDSNDVEILEEESSFPIKENFYSKIVDTKSIRLKEDLEKDLLSSKKNTTYKNLKLFFLIILFLVFLLASIFCVYIILKWVQDNHDTYETLQQIDEIAQVNEIKDNLNTELINQPVQSDSDYWYYIKFSLIQVNFDELLKKNKDTVAWIQVNNTNINYPVVQTNNNDYYLTHSYDQTINEAGWVFMDFRNSTNFFGNNTILYAHSRLDKTMFGSLSQVLKSSWYENKENHIIKLSTPTDNTLWQIFSVYKIKEESYYITTKFPDDNSYQVFLNTIKNRSKYNFNTELNVDDHILTLSTCYSDTERTVVHAKLIKRSKR